MAAAASHGPLPFRAYCDTPTVLRCAAFPFAMVAEQSIQVGQSPIVGASSVAKLGPVASGSDALTGSGGSGVPEAPQGFVQFPVVVNLTTGSSAAAGPGSASATTGSSSTATASSGEAKQPEGATSVTSIQASVLLPEHAPTCTRAFAARCVMREVAMQAIKMHQLRIIEDPSAGGAEAAISRSDTLKGLQSRGIPLLPIESASALLTSIRAAREAAAAAVEQRPRPPASTHEEAVFRARNPVGGHVEEDAMAVAISLCLAVMSRRLPEHGGTSEAGSITPVADYLDSVKVSVTMPDKHDAEHEDSRPVFVEPVQPSPEEASAAIAFSSETTSAVVKSDASGNGGDAGLALAYSVPALPEAPIVPWRAAGD